MTRKKYVARYLFAVPALALFSVFGAGASARAGTLSVTVTNIANGTGEILIAVCTKDLFLSPKCLPHKKTLAATGSVSVKFADLPPGRYAVEVVHDAKRLGALERDAMGIPIGGFGLSNDAVGVYGPPAFKDAAFDVGTEDKSIAVRLRYSGND